MASEPAPDEIWILFTPKGENVLTTISGGITAAAFLMGMRGAPSSIEAIRQLSSERLKKYLQEALPTLFQQEWDRVDIQIQEEAHHDE